MVGKLANLAFPSKEQNHVMHTKHRVALLQMETTLAVLGDHRRLLDEC